MGGRDWGRRPSTVRFILREEEQINWEGKMNEGQALRDCYVFKGLTAAELEKIARLAEQKEYEAGAVIFSEGTPAQEFFVLQEGKIALQTQLPMAQLLLNKKVTVDIATKNDAFGWSAVVEPYRYTLTAICLQRTRVLAIDGTKLRALLQNDNHMGYEVMTGLIKLVASRLDETRRVLVSERLVVDLGVSSA